MTVTGDELPIPEHHLDLPKGPDVSQGIIGQQDEIGPFPRLDRSDLTIQSQASGGLARAQGEGVHGREVGPANRDLDGTSHFLKARPEVAPGPWADSGDPSASPDQDHAGGDGRRTHAINQLCPDDRQRDVHWPD